MGEQEMTTDDKYFAMIGAILLQELHNSRSLRRKIKGTQLEQKLITIIKPRNNDIRRTDEPGAEIHED
jgi:hypothetical protein